MPNRDLLEHDPEAKLIQIKDVHLRQELSEAVPKAQLLTREVPCRRDFCDLIRQAEGQLRQLQRQLSQLQLSGVCLESTSAALDLQRPPVRRFLARFLARFWGCNYLLRRCLEIYRVIECMFLLMLQFSDVC